MANDAINTYLEEIKSDPAFDKDFIDLLISTHGQGIEGEKVAEKIIAIVNKRYVENQENKT